LSTWRVIASSERIIEDTVLLPVVLDMIIEACGCVVQDEVFRCLRSGRRAVGNSQLAPRVRRLQGIAEQAAVLRSGNPGYRRGKRASTGGLQERHMRLNPACLSNV